MKTRLFRWAWALKAMVLAVSSGCATQQAAHITSPLPPEKVENLVHFDVASCQTPSGPLSPVTNNETVLGGMLFVQPAILECFVPPQNRKDNHNIHVKLSTSVNRQTVLHEVEAENLNDAGVACMEAALASLQFHPLAPREEEKTASISIHYPSHSPQVVFGLNEASDVMGYVRLALGKACHCYAPMENRGVAELSMALALSPQQPAHISLAGNNPATQEMASCLHAELSKLNLRAARGELLLERVPLHFINSKATEFPPETKAELLFLHMDGLRIQNASLLALRLGEKIQAQAAHHVLSSKYKAHRPGPASIRHLDTSCLNLAQANEAWVSVLEAQFRLDQRIADIAARLRSGDARWEAVANRASELVLESRAALVEAQTTRASALNACKKNPSASPKPLKRR